MVEIPEQAVKAATEQLNISDMTLYDSYTKGQEAMVRRMLAAALPFLTVQGAVKKLDWHKGRAETPFGSYHVIEETNDDEPFWFVIFNGKAVSRCGTHDDEESAIFAAQADYERRIISAIEAASPLSKLKAGNARLEDQLAEALKALDGLLKPFEGDDCRYDHHGYCQAHFLQEVDECCVKIARRVLEGGEANG